jgi:hypothetical protein
VTNEIVGELGKFYTSIGTEKNNLTNMLAEIYTTIHCDGQIVSDASGFEKETEPNWKFLTPADMEAEFAKNKFYFGVLNATPESEETIINNTKKKIKTSFAFSPRISVGERIIMDEGKYLAKFDESGFGKAAEIALDREVFKELVGKHKFAGVGARE